MSADTATDDILRILRHYHELYKERAEELKLAGALPPDDDEKPWVIIVEKMTTAQAYEIAPILKQFGVIGVFQSGAMAKQMAAQWCHPKPPDPKKRYRKRKH